jgi:hypothetical protein
MIHKPKKADSEPVPLNKHWCIGDQMDFENIGVTRAISTDYKYLTCADCDRGPVGIFLTQEPAGNQFYVADARVKYLD